KTARDGPPHIRGRKSLRPPLTPPSERSCCFRTSHQRPRFPGLVERERRENSHCLCPAEHLIRIREFLGFPSRLTGHPAVCDRAIRSTIRRHLSDRHVHREPIPRLRLEHRNRELFEIDIAPFNSPANVSLSLAAHARHSRMRQSLSSFFAPS